MNKILAGILVAVAVVAFWLGVSLSNRTHELEAVRAQARQLEQDKQAMIDAIQAMAASRQQEQNRNDRLARALDEIRREPVTTGCGPSVHGAIDRLRRN